MLTLQEISDRLEIEELYSRYVHAVDAGEHGVLEDIFVAETVFDWTSSGGPRETWAEAKHGPMLKNEMFPFVFHACVNVVIDFDGVDGVDDGAGSGSGLDPAPEGATVRSKTIHPTGLYGPDGEPVLYQVHGVYVDRVRRTAAGWRIVERVWHGAWAVGGLTFAGGIPEMLAAAGAKPSQ
jgi:hypothetical protein